VQHTHLVWRLGAWGCAMGMALLFARTTKLGPSLSLWGGHGIHLGDVLAFALAYTWAATVTIRHRTDPELTPDRE
jgi:hypothetical protein